MSDAAEALKLDTTKVRGGTGLDAIRDEVDEVLQSAFDTTKSAAEAFFKSYDKNPNPKALAAWLANRCWREIDYVMLLNEQIRRYGLAYKRHHITLLAKQSFQEAEHYETVGKLVETLGRRGSDISARHRGALEQVPMGFDGPPSARGDCCVVRV